MCVCNTLLEVSGVTYHQYKVVARDSYIELTEDQCLGDEGY